MAKRRKNRKLTDEVVDEVCGHIEKGQAVRKACLLAGAGYDALLNNTTRQEANTEPKHPEWDDRLRRAKAVCIKHWLEILRKPNVTNAEVKSAQIMLGALEPERFRERHDGATSGVIVHIIQGDPNKPAPELIAEVLQPKALPAGGLNLPRVRVDERDS